MLPLRIQYRSLFLLDTLIATHTNAAQHWHFAARRPLPNMVLLVDFIDRQFIHNNPPAPTTTFKSKVVIVVGASSGLGLEACRSIIDLGALQVILTCRNIEKGKAAAQEIRSTTSYSPDTLQVWELDLSSYSSVQAFSDRVGTELKRVDAVIANAGVHTGKFRVTADNEESITTNVVSMSLLACLLLPKLRETARRCNTQTHFTVTGSELYEVAKFKESQVPVGQIFATLNNESKANMGDRYNVTKLLAMLVVRQIAAMSPLSSGVIVNCVAPGLCQSELHREHDNRFTRILLKCIARKAEVGSRTLVHGASAGPESHGQYLPDCKITPLKGLARGKAGDELQKRVWLELQQKLEGIRPGVTSLS